jgi:tol-pal system-associated acyl-CoA thioesterase
MSLFGTEFSIPIRIYIEDTDAGGIVFYANYLKFFERARTEFVRSIGFELRQSMTKQCNFVVHEAAIKYLASAKLDDELEVYTRVQRLRKTAIVFDQRALLKGANKLLVKAQITVACVDMETGRPRALPEDLQNVLN